MNRGRGRLAAVAAIGAAVLVGTLVAAPAHAAIGGSRITTPGDPSFLVADRDAATQTFSVSGTTSGGNPATDHVDIRCYYAGTYATVAAGVALQPNGSFSVPKADLTPILDHACTLRAVPAGSSPSNLALFSGPRVGVGERESSKVGGGPNNGRGYDYYFYAQQLAAAFDYVSLGSCGLYDGYLLDASYAVTTYTFWCNAGLFRNEANPATRSELQIDGANAYPPDQAESINPNAAGLPAVSHSYSVDPHTGDVAIHESDPLVKCADPTYPPTAVTCASFVSAGVSDLRTITQDHDGHISWITDLFTSTDGHMHSLDLLWDNNQRFWKTGGDSSRVAYEFPGQSAFSTHVLNDAVSLPAAPGAIFVRVNGAADGATATGQGAIVYDRSATTARFTFVGASDSEFVLHQTGTVPAGGSTRFRFAYIQDYHAANVAALARTASASFLDLLTVSRSGKGTGRVTSSPNGVGCGQTCVHGFPYGTSVSLAAKPAKGSSFARWTGACRGTGRCTVTTTADTTVNAKFVLRPCVVPSLRGKTLRAAKRALGKRFCSVGRIKGIASTQVASGRVVSQKPTPGTRLKQHAKVALVVSTG